MANVIKIDDTKTEQTYYAIRAQQPIEMPCGAKVTLDQFNQRCPNSGKCSAGHTECWVMKVHAAS